MLTKLENYLTAAIALAKSAGNEIMKLYPEAREIRKKRKPDGSFVTAADLRANELIVDGLKTITPDIPIITEESSIPDFVERKNWQHFWLVDPLDGTAEFLQQSSEFAVNIALIENNYPVLGVTYLPVTKVCYFAAQQVGAFKEDVMAQQTTALRCHKLLPADKIKVAISRCLGIGNLRTFLDQLTNYEFVYLGSSIKMCLVADGKVDVYPRWGSNCEWDTAAGQCIVEVAGGIVVDWSFKRLKYNTKETLESPPFVALGDPEYGWERFF